MKILILGANGMLGNALMYSLFGHQDINLVGTVRNNACKDFFPAPIANCIVADAEAVDIDGFKLILERERPQVVVNCIGIVKQIENGNDPVRAIACNALLPHQLAGLCKDVGARFIHISTDCVFSGSKGGAYAESDNPDPLDLYGRTKLLGEVIDQPHALTLRTSYIGNEFDGSNGLIEWFLRQEGTVLGYTRAIYSGVPTVVLANLIRDVVLVRPDLHGLYHVSSEPISKYNLLCLVAKIFRKQIEVIPEAKVVLDRSLDSSRFRAETGYVAPKWEEMLKLMYRDRMSHV
jgi:dTDP-4-dehydrorhamnose reductase